MIQVQDLKHTQKLEAFRLGRAVKFTVETGGYRAVADGAGRAAARPKPTKRPILRSACGIKKRWKSGTRVDHEPEKTFSNVKTGRGNGNIGSLPQDAALVFDG